MRHNMQGITDANDSIGGLDLRAKDDSNFLHSIYSRKIVKILCASQEHFEWGLLLTLECNMWKYFGYKISRE